MNNLSVITCPHCRIRVQMDWYSSNAFELQKVLIDEIKKIYSHKGKLLYYNTCNNCNKLIVKLIEGYVIYNSTHDYYDIKEILSEQSIYPESNNLSASEEIPSKFLSDFNEAVNVLPISPKSSAALTRRILQNILREEFDIKGRTLEAEINQFIQLNHIPSHISDAVDAIRNIGNLAAHPIKNESTGNIVDVEQGEAEWLIEVILALFDFTFIQPKKLDERRKQLNAKLKELGKPELKQVLTK